MNEEKNYRGSVSDRLDRLPFSKFHRNFILMVSAGEWVDTLFLLGNGVILALVAATLHFPTTVATYVVPSSFFAGEFIGSIVLGRFADIKGRKTVYLFNLLIFAFGMIIAAFMSSYYLISLFILIAGMGVGAEFPLTDSFTSEMVPSNQRGKRVALVYTIAVTSAPFIAFFAYELSIINKPLSWRIILLFMGILAVIIWFVRTRMLESPRWLETVGRFKDADDIVTKIEDMVMADNNLKSLPEPVYSEPRVNKSKFTDLFKPDVRKETIMMLIFQFFQSGIFYGFVVFVPTFLVEKGITLVSTLLFTMLIYFGFLIGSIANMFIIDKIERKYGIVITAILSGIFGVFFAIETNIILIVIFGFIVTFLLWNFSNFFHVYQAEIFPTRLRTTASGTVYAVSRISTSILTIIIATFVLSHGLLYTFLSFWLFIIIVVIDLLLLGSRSTKQKLENIVS